MNGNIKVQSTSSARTHKRRNTMDNQTSSLAIHKATAVRRHSSLPPRSYFVSNAFKQRNPEGQHTFCSKGMFQMPNDSVFRQMDSTTGIEQVRAKPSTILIFTGDNNDSFNRIASILTMVIPRDTYTISHLSYEALWKHPWSEQNALCLIVTDTSYLDANCWARINGYFNNSGKMLFLCQSNLLTSLSACGSKERSTELLQMVFDKRQSSTFREIFEDFLEKALKSLCKVETVNETFHVRDPASGYKYSFTLCKNEGSSPLLLYMENGTMHGSILFIDATSEQLLSSGTALIADALSRLSIETTSNVHIPALTQGYFICEYNRMPWEMQGMCFNEKFGSKPKILLMQLKKHGALPEPSSELVPFEVREREDHLPGFNEEIYFRRLETSKLGKALFFIPVCETTVEIGRSLAFAMPEEPVMIIAQQQTKGKGRSGNQWLSPIGCAMFTFNYIIPPDSTLARNIGFVQHIFAVAIADGICSLHKELENFPLKIKWPNDMYYGRMYKLGGSIVSATTMDNGKIVCTISAGLNLSNSKPTVCLNDFLPANLKIQPEDYFANTLNKFQYYVNMYETSGQDAFLKHYYRFWLHSREEVTLADTNEKVVICGLDQYGFLKVCSQQTGQTLTVHPDGNTFDMMKGLIVAKYA